MAKSISGNTSLTCTGNFLGGRTLTSSWQEFVSNDFVPTSTGTLTIGLFLGDVGTFRIDNIRLESIGALSLPNVQSINVLDDITSLGGNQSRLNGYLTVTNYYPESRLVINNQSFTTSTSVQILGGDVIGTRKQRILSVYGNSSASVNLSLGTSSGGTQLVNAQAVNGDFEISTFASRIIPSNSSLWITFSGNTTTSIIIKVNNL